MAIIKPNNNTLSSITALPAAIPTGAMVKLHSTSISSDTSSVSIDGHFTSDYDIYKFIVYDYINATDNQAIFFRANVGGSAQSSGIYFSGGQYSQTNTSNAHSNGSFGTYNAYNQQYFSWVSTLNNSGNDAIFVSEITLFNPLQTTKHKDFQYKSSYEGNSTDFFKEDVAGKIRTTSAVSGLTFIPASGNISKGEFVLLGVKK
jgi:hypothetical protein